MLCVTTDVKELLTNTRVSCIAGDVKELLTNTRVSACCVSLMAGAEVRGVCVVTVLLTSSVVDGTFVDVCNTTTPPITGWPGKRIVRSVSY